MRERAALVNGSIRLDSEPGLGTHVVVEIPVR
jgi:signal transduction histidine kinase